MTYSKENKTKTKQKYPNRESTWQVTVITITLQQTHTNSGNMVMHVHRINFDS